MIQYWKHLGNLKIEMCINKTSSIATLEKIFKKRFKKIEKLKIMDHQRQEFNNIKFG